MIDLALFAVPNSAATVDDVEEIFESVRAWATRAEKQTAFQLVVESSAIDVLSQANCFPATNNIRALLEMFSLDGVYSAQDINRRIFSLLERVGVSLDTFGFEVESCSIDDESFADLGSLPSEHLQESSRRALGCGCMLHERGMPPGMQFIVPGYRTTTNSGQFTATIVTGGETITVPSTALFVRTPEELLNSLDAATLWRCADTARELHLAVCIGAKEILDLEIKTIPFSEAVNTTVGEGFLQSLIEGDAYGAGPFSATVMSRCAEVAAGTSSRFARDFGSRNADGATGKRVHATKGGRALRLLYWQRTGSIEFANIGNKSKLEIFVGHPDNAESSMF